MNIILASGSRYKKAVLAKLGIPFETISPDIDESPIPSETAQDMAARLSKQKAKATLELLPPKLNNTEFIIIAADQVASHHNDSLGKPQHYENALKQLKQFSGDSVVFYTGICVIHSSGKLLSAVENYEVKFRELNNNQIHQYLISEEPYDCAGSFKCEEKGILLFESMHGRDINTLIGLPLIALNELLLSINIDLLSLLNKEAVE